MSKAAALLLATALSASEARVEWKDQTSPVSEPGHHVVHSDVDQAQRAGWVKRGSSLLVYDSSGTVTSEIGLGRWEDASGPGLAVHEIRGGVSPAGRFAWTLDTQTTWNALRSKKSSSIRLLRFYGANGRELWNDDQADTPTTGEPIRFSADGELCLVAQRSDGNWAVAVKTHFGNAIWELGSFPRLDAMELTANGRYALLRWIEPEKSATHTFLDIQAKTSKDIPSSELYLGQARIDENGRVFAGTKMVFTFDPKNQPPTAAP